MFTGRSFLRKFRQQHSRPTDLVVGHQPGFVARPDLPHLDSRPVPLRQFLNKLAKVDPRRRPKVEDDPLAAEQVLRGHDLHVEAQLVYDRGTMVHIVAQVGVQVVVLVDILLGGPPQDAPAAAGRTPCRCS